jgi:hypothetical protein
MLIIVIAQVDENAASIVERGAHVSCSDLG